MRIRTLHHAWRSFAFACLVTVAGIDRVAAAESDVREYVDEITAASITAAGRPLVFARERTDLAANARDYITLVAIEVNRAGQRSCFWWGYLWSTIDRRGARQDLVPGDPLVLIADGRPLPLRPGPLPPRDHGVGQPPLPPPVRSAIPVIVPATAEELAYVAAAGTLHVELLRGETPEALALWKDGRRAVGRLVERLDLEQ